MQNFTDQELMRVLSVAGLFVSGSMMGSGLTGLAALFGSI